MRHREVPIANGESLVFVIANTHHVFRLALHCFPIEIGRRAQDRIAAQQHECVDLAAFERVGQIADCAGRSFLRHVQEQNSFAVVLQPGVDQIRQHVNRGWLAMSGEYDRCVRIRLQIIGAFNNPFLLHIRRQREFPG